MWASFIIYGVLFSAIVWVLQRRGWKVWLRAALILFFASFLFIADYMTEGAETLGSHERWYTDSPGRETVLFVFMLFGMIVRYFTKAIEDRRGKISEMKKKGERFRKPRLEFDVWEFSYPLMISVITFGALLSQIGEAAPTLSNMTLSFQTGFFWQTILAAKQNPE